MTYIGTIASALGVNIDSVSVASSLPGVPDSTITSHAIIIRYGEEVQDVAKLSASAGFRYE